MRGCFECLVGVVFVRLAGVRLSSVSHCSLRYLSDLNVGFPLFSPAARENKGEELTNSFVTGTWMLAFIHFLLLFLSVIVLRQSLL